MLVQRARALSAAILTAAALAACGGGSSGGGGTATQFGFTTTRLCALVPARDAAAAAYPPTPPVKVFGTDLGWTYERDGVITMLFGDSWQRIDICPLQPNDDSLATLERPDAAWPGFEATQSLPDSQCPALTFAVNEAGNAFAPITLQRWDGEPVLLGPLNTPVVGFYDGQREWAVFIVGDGQSCTVAESMQGAACPSALSAAAADLTCGFVGGAPICLDPGSTKHGAGSRGYYLHFAERVGPSAYVSRAMFLTNRYLNLTARTVAAFEEGANGRRDYAPGTAALLMWGRPGFDDQSDDGEAPPYFMYHPLPLPVVGDRLALAPRYLTGVDGNAPRFDSHQSAAVPLYRGEFEPVNHAAVSWIAPLRRWLMIYGGSTVDYVNRDGSAGESQPVPGALHARLAADAWGPWNEAEPILTNEQVAEDIVCGKQAPAGCLPPPSPLIRPACLEFADPGGGGVLYGANIIDSFTRSRRVNGAPNPAADVFWNVSTWHPYSVVLVKTRITPQ